MGLFSVIDTEFFPQADESTVYATVELQTGTRVDNTIRTADMLDSLFKAKYPEVKIISTTSGYDDQGGWESMFNAGGTHTIQYTISLVPIEERKRSVWDISEEMRADLAKFPGYHQLPGHYNSEYGFFWRKCS